MFYVSISWSISGPILTGLLFSCFNSSIDLCICSIDLCIYSLNLCSSWFCLSAAELMVEKRKHTTSKNHMHYLPPTLCEYSFACVHGRRVTILQNALLLWIDRSTCVSTQFFLFRLLAKKVASYNFVVNVMENISIFFLLYLTGSLRTLMDTLHSVPTI